MAVRVACGRFYRETSYEFDYGYGPTNPPKGEAGREIAQVYAKLLAEERDRRRDEDRARRRKPRVPRYDFVDVFPEIKLNPDELWDGDALRRVPVHTCVGSPSSRGTNAAGSALLPVFVRQPTGACARWNGLTYSK